jgi:hypothetical protein
MGELRGQRIPKFEIYNSFDVEVFVYDHVRWAKIIAVDLERTCVVVGVEKSVYGLLETMMGNEIPPCIFEIAHCVSMSMEMIQMLVGELLKVHPWRATA